MHAVPLFLPYEKVSMKKNFTLVLNSDKKAVMREKVTVVATWCLQTYTGMRPYMVKVYIKERINDQTTVCSGGVTGNTTYLG